MTLLSNLLDEDTEIKDNPKVRFDGQKRKKNGKHGSHQLFFSCSFLVP